MGPQCIISGAHSITGVSRIPIGLLNVCYLFIESHASTPMPEERALQALHDYLVTELRRERGRHDAELRIQWSRLFRHGLAMTRQVTR